MAIQRKVNSLQAPRSAGPRCGAPSARRVSLRADAPAGQCSGGWRSNRSVQAELTVEGAQFRRTDQPRVGDRHGVQRSFELLLPELEEFLQQREVRKEIV